MSPATLSRIENGHLPDLETFRRICDCLEVSPAEVLGSRVTKGEQASTRWHVHFKKDKATAQKTARALADMIMAAAAMVETKEE